MSATTSGDQSATTVSDTHSNPDLREDQTAKRGLIGVVKADHAELRAAAAGLVFATDEVLMERSGARDVVSGGDVRITQGGAGVVIAAGAVRVRQGGAGTMVSLGRIDLEQSGAGIVIARDVAVGRGGLVALAVTPRLAVSEGGRVFAGPATAAAAIAGFGLGIIISRLLRLRSG